MNAQQEVFEVTPVRDLPWPHEPYKCSHHARFERIYAEVKIELRGHPGGEIEQRAGQRFWESLTARDRRSCPWHQANWRDIADEAVRIVRAGGEREAFLDAVRDACLSDDDQQWLASIFYEPIDITGGEYSNGQHRACAIRFSGAEQIPVVSGYAPPRYR